MICKGCGAQLAPNERFCSDCGRPVEVQAMPTQQVPPMQQTQQQPAGYYSEVTQNNQKSTTVTDEGFRKNLILRAVGGLIGIAIAVAMLGPQLTKNIKLKNRGYSSNIEWGWLTVIALLLALFSTIDCVVGLKQGIENKIKPSIVVSALGILGAICIFSYMFL